MTGLTIKNKIWKAIKQEFTGWTPFQAGLLGVALTLIITLGVFSDHPNPVMICAGVFSFTGVMLGARGKISTFVISTIGAALYIVVSLQFHNTANVIFQAAFGIPMNFFGFYSWFKNRNQQGNVLPKQMSFQGLGVSIIAFISIYLIYGFVVPQTAPTSAQHWVDALVLVVMFFAMIMMLFRFIDQWYLWILANFVQIALWIVILVNIANGTDQTGNDTKTAAIGIVNFVASQINALYGLYNWFKMYQENPKYQLKVLQKEEIKELNNWNKTKYFANKFFTKHQREMEINLVK